MDMAFKPTIGLEIHAELKTRTKMFCDSLNNPDERHPNVNVCPVCLGHPGTLPVINKKAVEAVIRVGLAVGGNIAPVTKFDRKNYFYPDLPKGYQISQYDMPLVSGGELCGVRIIRVHLEEDTGTLSHAASGAAKNSSLVDFNRAGVPLMELVTEPDIHTAEQALTFARELQLLLRYLGVSDANMEKGEMRVEVNLSMSDNDEMGTKVEVKNINSFKAVESAIAQEIERQSKRLEKGEKIVQETRGWDDAKQTTVSQRSKENAHEYRYFPEPDLPPFTTDEFGLDSLKGHLPELPAQKRVRLRSEFALDEAQTEFLVGEPRLADYFEEAVSELHAILPEAPAKTLYNYLTSDLRGLMSEAEIGWDDLKIDPEHLAHLAALIEEKKITSRQAKDMLVRMLETGLDPEDVMKNEGISVVSGGAELEDAAKAVLTANPQAVADFKKGKAASMQFLIGKTMALLKGRAEPEALRKLLEELLK